MASNRRRWLIGQAATLGLLLGGCAVGQGGPGNRIVDTATGRRVDEDELVERLRAADFVLLGEVHDNPLHHAQRGRLIAAMGEPVPVIAEHLPRGAAPALAKDASGEALRQVLEAAGFDARAWQWPLHEPLFAAIARAGDPLHGGNLPLELVRRVAREGGDALPAELRELVKAAPLPGAAQEALEQDLQQGHCGQLPASRLPGMVWAQRGRDSTMALAMASQLNQWRAMGRRGPVVLVAGNGHVRRDYGVPQLLAALVPHARVLAVGFVEEGGDVSAWQGLYDLAWTTTAAAREDPCDFSRDPPARQG